MKAPGFDGRSYDSSWITCIVRVHTDDGLIGIGEADSVPEVVRAIIETPSYHSRAMGLKAVVMGCDPCDPAGVWDRMYDATYMYGRRGAVIHAISAIDLALWDIRGKAEGKPVADLLGGTLRRPRIQAYGTVYAVHMSLLLAVIGL